ncbi:hypothetical protein P171DRAFT_190241 [Karstenula rhodostoma CBS 690.94]|uniref:Uncharacterized protein n=1 Tax=Karstenula rhodostoma CBS 690.94 TaxID=1392251 RepID=A0A9P4UHJ0_9PLEO|nr:hypothetical protein P171DRAFT_190241 [Karstenula rhodostoma CBS 690.94]
MEAEVVIPVGRADPEVIDTPRPEVGTRVAPSDDTLVTTAEVSLVGTRVGSTVPDSKSVTDISLVDTRVGSTVPDSKSVKGASLVGTRVGSTVPDGKSVKGISLAGTDVSIAEVSPTDVVGASDGVGLTWVSFVSSSVDVKSEGSDKAEVGAAEGSKSDNGGKSLSKGAADDDVVVASDTPTDVGSAVGVTVDSTLSVEDTVASIGVAEGTGVAPVPDAPGREITSLKEVETGASAEVVGTSEAVSEAGIVGSTGLTEVRTSEMMEEIALLTSVGMASTSDLTEETMLLRSVGSASTSDLTEETMLLTSVGRASISDLTDELTLLISVGSASTSDLTEDTTLETMLLISVGIASTSDLTEDRTLLMADGTLSMSDCTEDTTLLIDEGTLSTSEMIDEMGRRSGKEGAAVVSGTSVLVLECEVAVASKLVVVGPPVWLVSVASSGWVRDLVGVSITDSVLSSAKIEDGVTISAEVVSVALDVDTSVTVGSGVAVDSLCRLRVCDGVGVSMDPDKTGSSLVVCGTSELASDVEGSALELTDVTSSVVSGTTPELVSDTSVDVVETGPAVVDGFKLELITDDVVALVADGSALEVTSEVATSVDSGTTIELDSAVMASVLEIDALKVGSEVGSSPWEVLVSEPSSSTVVDSGCVAAGL